MNEQNNEQSSKQFVDLCLCLTGKDCISPRIHCVKSPACDSRAERGRSHPRISARSPMPYGQMLDVGRVPGQSTPEYRWTLSAAKPKASAPRRSAECFYIQLTLHGAYLR